MSQLGVWCGDQFRCRSTGFFIDAVVKYIFILKFKIVHNLLDPTDTQDGRSNIGAAFPVWIGIELVSQLTHSKSLSNCVGELTQGAMCGGRVSRVLCRVVRCGLGDTGNQGSHQLIDYTVVEIQGYW